MPTREKTAGRGGACNERIRPYGSLSQAAEIPAHNRAYPGSRPGGTTRLIGGITTINNPNVVSTGGDTDTVTIKYGLGVSSPETTFVNKNGELITTQDYTVQVSKNSIVRVSGTAKGNFVARGNYTFICGEELSDFAMFIYGNVGITGV